MSFFGTGYDDSVISMIPIAGALYQKYQLNKKYAERTGMDVFNVPGVSGIFGATDRYEPYMPKRYTPYAKGPRKPKKAKTKVWKTYMKKAYAHRTYARKSYHRESYADKVYAEKTYGAFGDVTKGGVSRKLNNRLIPKATYNIKYLLKVYHSYV